MARLLLVRHGQSEWNADGRWQGQADPPLSDLGRRQAIAAGASIGAVDAIVASPLERAYLTAAAISEAVGVGPVLVEPGLVERHAGDWQGLTRTQIDAQYPGYLDDTGDRRRRPPGWEHDDVLLERVLAALGRVLSDLDGADDIVVVTHGGVIYAVEGHLGASFERIPNLGARWVTGQVGGPLVLGERLLLVDPDAVAVTTPDQI
jgi:probable phosphoglycerate mutase